MCLHSIEWQQYTCQLHDKGSRLEGDDPDEILDLWWLMHHSDDPNNRSLAVAHYVDDSGTHDGSEIAVVGGPLFSRSDFFEFHYEWDRLVRIHGIEPPVHMKEFARPHGRFAHLSDAKRRALFSDLVALINDRKGYSLTVFLDGPTFLKAFPPDQYRKLLGCAALTFLYCLFSNYRLSVEPYTKIGSIAYVVADSDINGQMVEMHSAWRKFETSREGYEEITGSFTIDKPSKVCALQAADLVSWSNRKATLGDSFDRGFEPLKLLTEEATRRNGARVSHVHLRVGDQDIEKLRSVLTFGLPHKKIGRMEFSKWITGSADLSRDV